MVYSLVPGLLGVWWRLLMLSARSQLDRVHRVVPGERFLERGHQVDGASTGALNSPFLHGVEGTQSIEQVW